MLTAASNLLKCSLNGEDEIRMLLIDLDLAVTVAQSGADKDAAVTSSDDLLPQTNILKIKLRRKKNTHTRLLLPLDCQTHSLKSLVIFICGFSRGGPQVSNVCDDSPELRRCCLLRQSSIRALLMII